MKTSVQLMYLVSLQIVACSCFRVLDSDGQDLVSTNAAVPQLSVDSDGDGFSDFQELIWGTDPHDPNSHPDLISGVTAWWPLDEGFGLQAGDVSGQNHAILFQGNSLPVWSSDASGNALGFTPTSYITLPDASGLIVTDVFTMVAWCKLSPDIDGDMISKSNVESQATSYTFSVHQNHVLVRLRVGDNVRSLNGRAIVADSQWHHLACVYDGFDFRIYVDGVLDVRSYIGGVIADGSGSLDLGKISGSLRDVGLYRRAFRGAEISLLYDMVSNGTAQLAKRRPAAPGFFYAQLKPHSQNQSVRIETSKGSVP